MTVADAQRFTERSGTSGGGAPYLIRVPSDWNGVLLNDLDYVSLSESPARAFLLERGYALSGTSRLVRDYATNVENQLRVLDAFAATFDQPRYTVQFGCSGGGMVALRMAEEHSDRVDGTLPMCSASLVMLQHLFLDFLFVFKALLAPESDLPINEVDPGRALPQTIEEASSNDRWNEPSIERWRTVVNEAQTTAIGRARIALGLALAQWPSWGGFLNEIYWQSPGAAEEPPPSKGDDVETVQQHMFSTALAGVTCARAFFIDPVAPVYSNQGIDYVGFYDNADREQRRVVRELYRAAGSDPTRALHDDLQRVNAADRIAAPTLPFVDKAMRPHTGRPLVPTLHVSTMDACQPVVVMRGYLDRARAQGKARLYRQAFVQRANHCGFSVSEIAALVETLVGRLETGAWGDSVRPERLNALAASYGVDDSLFFRYRPPRQNRALFADPDPQGAY